jgi:hypothetical protein
MMDSDKLVFLQQLTRTAACFPLSAPNLELVTEPYFDALQTFDLAIVINALRMALDTSDFFPTIAQLKTLAASIRRETFEAERHQHTQHKLLAYQQDALASDLSPAERQITIAEILANLGDSMRMPAVTSTEPRARPPVRHEAYRVPTKDPAARRQELRDQIARVQREEEDRTSATVSSAAG